MDTMDRYKIQESIKDTIAILDSAPIHIDLIPETNAVQLTNRAPIAHLAIERGLKALICKVRGNWKHMHSLDKLHGDLRDCDAASADYLDESFEDAVRYFGYDVDDDRFEHFRSLEDYLVKVGTKEHFEALRYWAIGESSDENPIPYISPPVHRELLCTLWCLFFPNRRETVSDRVERKVAHAMFDGRLISYDANDTQKKQSVQWYKNWLCNTHTSSRLALKEAVDKGFAITDDEFVNETLRDAYNELQQSKDPAVQYYIRTLEYLPKDSQRRNPDAIPEVEWHGQDQTNGSVLTPTGTCLGFIEKYADGAWGITPLEGGLVQVAEIAKSMADAKHYLVNRLTRQVTATINRESKQLRIVSEHDFFLPHNPSWTLGVEDSVYEVELWDANHGLRPSDEVSMELQSETMPESVSVLEGKVTAVEKQSVSVTGTDCLYLKKDR